MDDPARDPYAVTAPYYDIMTDPMWRTLGPALAAALADVDPTTEPVIDLGAGPPLTEDNTPLTGQPTFVGLGCDPLAAAPAPGGTRFSGGARGTATMSQIDTYSVLESPDAAYGVGFGDLSVHEVAMTPTQGPASPTSRTTPPGSASSSTGSGDRGSRRLHRRGRQQLLGVEVHEVNGEQVVLASDRDFGPYIFRYTGR